MVVAAIILVSFQLPAHAAKVRIMLVNEYLADDGDVLERVVEIYDPVEEQRFISQLGPIPLGRRFDDVTAAKRHLVAKGRGEELMLPRGAEVSPELLARWSAAGYEPVWEHRQRPLERCPQPTGIQVLVNGRPLGGLDPVRTKHGVTMVPMRAIFQRLGAQVSWSPSGRITAHRGSREVVLELGRRASTVNGSTVALQAAPEVWGGTTYVPLRFVAEALGDDVRYDPQGRVILIQSAVQAGGEPPAETPLQAKPRRVTMVDKAMGLIGRQEVSSLYVDGGLLYRFSGPAGVVGPNARWRLAVRDLDSGQVVRQVSLPWDVVDLTTVHVRDGVVYTIGTDRVLALSASTGEVLWCAHVDARQGAEHLYVGSDAVYVADRDWNLHALDRWTGKPRWVRNYERLGLVVPSEGEDVVLAHARRGDRFALYAFDAGTGELRWRFGDQGDGTFRFKGIDFAAVAWNDQVFVSADETFYALDKATGSVVWSYAHSGVASKPAVSDGTVYFTEFRGVRRLGDRCRTAVALDAQTGKELWVASTEDCSGATPVAVGPVLYVPADGAKIYALDKRTGARLWVWDAASEAGWDVARVPELYVHEGRLYFFHPEMIYDAKAGWRSDSDYPQVLLRLD